MMRTASSIDCTISFRLCSVNGVNGLFQPYFKNTTPSAKNSLEIVLNGLDRTKEGYIMPKKRPRAIETEGLTFPVRLRAAMDFRGENQTSLAPKVNIKRQTIGYYMRGQSQPDVDNLAALSRALGVSADWLIGTSKKETPALEVNDIYSYFGANAVHLIVEKDLGESAKTDFINLLLSDESNLDKLILAIKARRREAKEKRIILDFEDISLSEAEEASIIDAATKAMAEKYFWKIIDRPSEEGDTENGID